LIYKSERFFNYSKFAVKGKSKCGDFIGVLSNTELNGVILSGLLFRDKQLNKEFEWKGELFRLYIKMRSIIFSGMALFHFNRFDRANQIQQFFMTIIS